MFTDEDYLDELLKSIEPITKQNEEEPEPEEVVEEQVEATPVLPVEEPVFEVPSQPETVFEVPGQPETIFEMPSQPETQLESSVFDLGSGDMGMSEAEIDALINAAKNTPLTTGGSSPNYVETPSIDFSQEPVEEFENKDITNEPDIFDGNPEIIQTGNINDMDIPMDLFADPDSFETIITPVSADNVSGQELMDLGLFTDEADVVTIESPVETNFEEVTDKMSGMDNGEDIADLLGQFSDDSDISDIMSILEKDEKNEAIDETMFAAYDEAEKLFEESENSEGDVASEDMSETEEDKKKPRKKKEKPLKEKKEKVKKEKVKKEKKVNQPEGDNPEDVIKEKNPGFFSKLVTIMTQEENEADVPEISETGITDENADILRELSKEDKKKKIKGDKKDKKDKKEKKNKKGKKPEKEETEDDIREKSDKDDEDTDSKKKKGKKEKKEKKTKKLKVMELSVPEKKIPRRYIIATVAFCMTIMFGIIILSSVYTNLSNAKTARWAFDNGDYQTAYEQFYGEDLSEEDQLIFDKSAVILTIQRKLDSYNNFKKLGMEIEALNALFEGVEAYRRISVKAEQLNVISKVDRIYQELFSKFEAYGLSETEVDEILNYESDAAYTKKLESIVTGVPFEELYE